MGGRGNGPERSDGDRLEAQIEQSRAQLAASIDAIAAKVAPANVAQVAKSRAREVVVNPDGSLKTDRVIKIAAVAGAVLVLWVWRHRR
ncbi:MAG: DUF3618 domain-containing protein [Sporichthyaceae bacterium]